MLHGAIGSALSGRAATAGEADRSDLAVTVAGCPGIAAGTTITTRSPLATPERTTRSPGIEDDADPDGHGPRGLSAVELFRHPIQVLPLSFRAFFLISTGLGHISRIRRCRFSTLTLLALSSTVD